MDREHHRIVIIGGGSAGIAVAAQLKREGEKDIAIIEPSTVHYYQPGWSLVAGGIKSKEQTVRPMSSVIPKGVMWIRDSCATFQPNDSQVTTSQGRQVSYDSLVVAAGLESHWDGIKGLPESIDKGHVISIYDFNHAPVAWDCIKNLEHGRVIFTQPLGAVKCGGAPQKIMWLADEYFRKKGVRDQIELTFAIPQKQMFAINPYSETLDRYRQRQGIKALYGMELISIDPQKLIVTFKNVDDGSLSQAKFDLLHVVPPMSAPEFIRNSPLADEAGYVAVDAKTLQSTKYPNIFAIGDCSSLPTSKTMAAISVQAPVLVHNLLQFNHGRPLTANYDGYTSCPLIMGYNKLLLAEFKYGKELQETFSPYHVDQSQPRWAFMVMKQHILPFVYWNLFLKGRWYGPNMLLKPKFERER